MQSEAALQHDHERPGFRGVAKEEGGELAKLPFFVFLWRSAGVIALLLIVGAAFLVEIEDFAAHAARVPRFDRDEIKLAVAWGSLSPVTRSCENA